MKKILILILLALFTFTNKSYGMEMEEITEVERRIEADVDNRLEKEVLEKAVFYYIENIKIESKTYIEKIFRKYENLCEKSFLETCMRMSQNYQREREDTIEDFYYQNIIEFLYLKLTNPSHASELTRSNRFVRENVSDRVNRYDRAKISMQTFSLGKQQEL